MTDRELLEMAAKAAGYWAAEFNCPAVLPRPEWNPITDDGDALRLAVKLQICLNFELNGPGNSIRIVEAYKVIDDDGSCHCPMETQGDDPYAATRRAIVRAAAEIGKSL